MLRYQVSGRLEYLQFCPKAPGVDLCDPPASCAGHTFVVEVDVFVDAPDEDRAEWAALKKLQGPYPWPQFTVGGPVIDAAALPTVGRRGSGAPEGTPLPGFELAVAGRS